MTDFDILSEHDVLAVEHQGDDYYDLYSNLAGSEEFAVTSGVELLKKLAYAGVELIDRRTKEPFAL